MLDIRFVREHPEQVQENTRRKGYDVSIDELLRFDDAKRQLQQQVDELREKRNDTSSRLKGGRPSDELVAEGKVLKDQLNGLEVRLKEVDTAFLTLFKKVPNMALEDVPVGASEDENVVAKKVGEPGVYNFEPKNHAELAEAKGWLDKERAAKIAGSRFAYLKGDLVRLQFAIVQWIMDTLTNEEVLKKIIKDNSLNTSAKPFVPIIPPAMIRTEPYEATSRLDKEEVTYKIEQDDLWLNASAEHSLVPMYMNEILSESELPIRYIGYSTSFRREAGTYGKDMEGMFRMHQFDKLEMEAFTTADMGLDEHKFMVAIQEYITSQLEIPYRVLQKCTADIGFANATGVDIEMWLPGQNKYRETHTADYMTDYQARRLKTRVRRASGDIELVHTNDGTALPLSRGPIAILETHQQADGSVTVPAVLRPYLGGREIL